MDRKDDTIESRSVGNELETANLSDVLAQELSERELSDVVRTMNFWRVAMTIVEFDIQLVVNVSGPVMLGRSSGTDNDYNYIDLSPYNAHNYGVSRHHAILALHEDKVIIRDNSSSNGTLLNNKKLKELAMYPLRKGDRVRLGELELRFNMLYNPFSSGKNKLLGK